MKSSNETSRITIDCSHIVSNLHLPLVTVIMKVCKLFSRRLVEWMDFAVLPAPGTIG